MSKTWRRDERKKRGKRPSSQDLFFGENERKSKVISFEWAWNRVSDHVLYLFAELRELGYILDGEDDIYCDIVKKALADSLGDYDPSIPGKDGRTSTPTHYCIMVVERACCKIKRTLKRAFSDARHVPISQMPQEESAKLGYVSEGSLSDNCRNITKLWFAMDMNTFVGMLTPLQLQVLRARLDGMSLTKLGAEMGLSRYIVTSILKEIQDKARKCGFIPRGEVSSENF